MTLLLTVAVVVLGAWAVSAESDADTAQAQLTVQEDAAGAQTQQRYAVARSQLGQVQHDVDEIQRDLDGALAAADDAVAARDAADGAVATARAEADAVRARGEVTRQCLRGSLDALDAAFSGGGLDAAVEQLEALAARCRSAAGF